MTGNLLVDSLISIAGIGVLVLVARFLFPARRKPISQAGAEERLAFEEPDFEPAEWLVDEEAGCALAQSFSGEFALVRQLGIDLVVRRFPKSGTRASFEDGQLVLRFSDAGFAKAAFKASAAAQWARKLGVEEYT